MPTLRSPQCLLVILFTLLLVHRTPVRAEHIFEEHIHGTILNVDYHRAKLIVDRGHARHITIVVLPSTNISERNEKRDEYHGFSELRPGTPIDVYVSQRNDQWTAESLEYTER